MSEDMFSKLLDAIQSGRVAIAPGMHMGGVKSPLTAAELLDKMKDVLFFTKYDLEKDKRVAPVIFLYTDSGADIILIPPSGDSPGQFVHALVHQIGDKINSYIFASAGWVVEHERDKLNLTSKEEEKLRLGIRPARMKKPSEDPNRKECITIVGASREGAAQILITYKIDNKQIIFDKPRESLLKPEHVPAGRAFPKLPPKKSDAVGI